MSLIGEVYICKQFITSPIHIKLNSHGLTVVFPRFCFYDFLAMKSAEDSGRSAEEFEGAIGRIRG